MKSKHLIKNKQKCIKANRSTSPNANINSCSKRRRVRERGSGGKRTLTGFRLKHTYAWKTTMNHHKSVIGLAGERVVCDTAKVWCKQEQNCISSHSPIMTVKSSLEAPLFLRTKDNFLGSMPCMLFSTQRRGKTCASDKTWYHISTKCK